MLNVKETRNISEIKKVLCHPDIYERSKDDYCPESRYFEPPEWATYIGGYLDDDIIGLMVYHTEDDGLKCHFQVLPEHRIHAIQFARMALNFGEAKNASIYVEIPGCYPEVIFFAKGVNFKESGVIEKIHKKNGKFYNVTRLRRKHGIYSRRMG